MPQVTLSQDAQERKARAEKRKSLADTVRNKPEVKSVRELQARIEALEAIVAELIAKD